HNPFLPTHGQRPTWSRLSGPRDVYAALATLFLPNEPDVLPNQAVQPGAQPKPPVFLYSPVRVAPAASSFPAPWPAPQPSVLLQTASTPDLLAAPAQRAQSRHARPAIHPAKYESMCGFWGPVGQLARTVFYQ